MNSVCGNLRGVIKNCKITFLKNTLAATKTGTPFCHTPIDHEVAFLFAFQPFFILFGLEPALISTPSVHKGVQNSVHFTTAPAIINI